MKIAEIVEQWFQANFHNNTYYQREELFAHARAAKEDLLKRLAVESGLGIAPEQPEAKKK
jgi:hypothetical protein